MPLKFDFYHFGSETVVGDTIDRLPILDWHGWYGKKLFEHRYKGPRQNGFTGVYNSTLFASITIFRHQFNFRLDFAFGQTTPELAYNEYHNRIKAARRRE